MNQDREAGACQLCMAAVLAFLALMTGTAAPAMAQTPTAEQIEAISRLPPDQQRILKEQATRSGAVQADAPLDFPDTGKSKVPEGDEAGLKPFGYDLFRAAPTTFAPATDIPVPAEYVLGPGDTLEVLLVGERGGRHRLVVGRDGVVDFPGLGPITVTGLRFEEARDLLEQRVAEQMIGMRASISMGPLRSIQIFVLGEAESPGSYTVSGLSTITNALLVSGGPKTIGSLRSIQLKRDGRSVATIDLYDLLLDGNTSADQRLQPGDVIFIPPVGTTVAVTGEIRRPAIYEVSDGAVASDMLYLAGGLTPQADPRTAKLERVDDRRNRTVVDIDLTTPAGRGTRLQTGDQILIQPIRDSREGVVTLAGHVFRGGAAQYRTGMRLTDLVGSEDELKPLADQHYVLVRRETGATRRVSVVSADLAAAFANPASAANLPLQARDQVHVFDLATSRESVIAPIMVDLQRQSERDQPLQAVSVGGNVKVPGQYPLEAGMRVSDLLRAGGSLDQAAYGIEAELTRYEVVGGERRQTEIIRIDLGQLLAGSPSADVALRSFDYLVIKAVPQWGEQETITVAGEVRFPGTYPIKRGETLAAVVERAGGLTDLAFVDGVVFTRKGLRDREAQQIAALTDRLERDLATLAVQSSQAPQNAAQGVQSLSVGQSLLAELRQTQPVGRLAIDLRSVLKAGPGSSMDILLKDEDRLLVPRRSQEVTVLGEVQAVTSHLYQAQLSRDDYVNLSGGLAQKADRGRIYVVRANGQVAASGSRWFASRNTSIRPGDTIVVPVDTERLPPLPLWTSVTSIIYNLAVAVAAVNSF